MLMHFGGVRGLIKVVRGRIAQQRSDAEGGAAARGKWDEF